jgi:CRISPR-associated protein Cst1
MTELLNEKASQQAGALALTAHPLQRTGAWAVAVLAGRGHPDEVTTADLDAVTARIVRDVVRAATAGKDQPAYDWWKVLYALFPNAKPTHASRPRDAAVLTGEVQQFFAADRAEDLPLRCVFCGATAGTLWSKSMLPMFDTTKFRNTLPPGTVGWPVCRACRIAVWAMPYGAAVTAGSATVLTCDDDTIERKLAADNCDRAARIQQVGFSSLPSNASPEAVTLWALRNYATRPEATSRPVATTLWMFKNDNQEPWLRVTATRLAVVGFLRALPTEPAAERGWRRLQHALTRRAADGTVGRNGRDVVARTLFEPVNAHRDRLLVELFNRRDAVEKTSGSTLRAWRALSALYLREMCGMDTGDLKPVTRLLVDWIMAEKNPRGRFNEYRKVAGRTSGLQRLLMEASARLLLDGHRPSDITGVTGLLFASTAQGWQLRGQLFFEVVAELVVREAAIGTRTAGESDDSDDPDEPLVGVGPDGNDTNDDDSERGYV